MRGRGGDEFVVIVEVPDVRDAAQGFLFGAPLEAEELPAYFREQPWWRHF